MERAKKEFIQDIFLEMYASLLIFARSELRDDHRSEELVQEAFLIAIEKVDAVMSSPNPKGWIHNTLKNLIMHEHRTRQKVIRMFMSLDILDDKDQPAKADEHEIDLKELFTPDEWNLLEKAYIQQYSIAEIAQELGIQYDACRKRLQKLRTKAKKLLGDE